jgi:glutathione-regulated potassium-efflux system protein KefB
LLFCIDGNSLTARKLAPILEAFPQAAVFVRAFDRVHLMELAPLDIKGTVREVFESAVCMGREALTLFLDDAEEAKRVEREYRDRDSERLHHQTRSGDLHALKESMFSPENEIAAQAQPEALERNASTSASSTD